MPNATFPTAILCDHVTRDQENKHSLIGVYAGDVVVAEFPARLRLAIYLEFQAPKEGPHKIDIELRLNGQNFMKGAIAANINDPKQGTAIALPNFDLQLRNEVLFEVLAGISGSPLEVVLTKKLRQNPDKALPPSDAKEPAS